MNNPERSLSRRIEDHYLGKAEEAEKQGKPEVTQRDFDRAEKADLMAEYRKLQAKASELSRNYHGTEAEYVELMNTLLQWDELIDLHDLPSPTTPRDEYAALELNEHNPKLIDDFLGAASANADAFLEATLSNQNENSEIGVLFQKSELVFLPGSDIDQNEGNGKKELKEVRFDQIIKNIVGLLRKNGIFDDDVIITRGADPKETGMMREAPYYKIDIPRLNRTVLACEQVGESTYVIQAVVTNEFVAEYTKEELLMLNHPRITRIERRGHWADKMRLALFTDNAPGTKIDLRNERNKLEQKTPEQWAEVVRNEISLDHYLGMTMKDRRVSRFEGVSISAIGARLGYHILGDATLVDHLQIARRIWTNEKDQMRIDALIEREQRTLDEWATMIRKQMTLEQYLAMTVAARVTQLKVDGVGLTAIAVSGGFDGRLMNRTLPQLQLAKRIWTSAHDQAKIDALIEREKRTREDWARTVRERIALDQYLGMTTTQRARELEIDGAKISAIAKPWGIDHEEIYTTIHQLRLAKFIWTKPEELARIDALIEREQRTPEEWARTVREQVTLDQYLGMNAFQRTKNLYVDGAGLIGLGGHLNAPNKFVSESSQLELAKHIWTKPEELARIDALIEREQRTPEEWARAVREQVTLDQYLRMFSLDRRTRMKVDGAGLYKIASILGMKKDHVSRVPGQLELAKHIWTSPEEQQRIQQEIDKIA